MNLCTTFKCQSRISIIVFLAIISRLFTWFVAFLSVFIIDAYDSASDIILVNESSGIIQKHFNSSFHVFLRWDSFYFLHLTEEGYVYEQEHAFFPLFPFLARLLGNSLFLPLGFFLTYKQILLLSGVLIANASFVLASVYLYKLSLKLFHDETFAFITALFYILTPSCMFMSAMYTESLFALLSFLGMNLFVSGKLWSSAFLWLLASLTRSNGIIFSGFFVFNLIIKEIKSISLIKFVRLIKTIILCSIVFLGFGAFQLYGFDQFCIYATPIRPWCLQSSFPLLYQYVQKHYWNCGFLTYYEFKQIPNFLFALPMISLSFFGIYKYANYDYKRMISLGLQSSQPLEIIKENSNIQKDKHNLSPYFSSDLLPFIYLWLILLLYAITSMHIQVITRFFSSLPTVYWFATHLFVTSISKNSTELDKKFGYTVLYYFVLYGWCGIVLFANYFPPA